MTLGAPPKAPPTSAPRAPSLSLARSPPTRAGLLKRVAPSPAASYALAVSVPPSLGRRDASLPPPRHRALSRSRTRVFRRTPTVPPSADRQLPFPSTCVYTCVYRRLYGFTRRGWEGERNGPRLIAVFDRPRRSSRRTVALARVAIAVRACTFACMQILWASRWDGFSARLFFCTVS